MDPASAGVAFVGFTASLATLTAVVIDSSKTLYNLRNKLRNTPEDVRRLIRQFSVFESLLKEVQGVLQDHGDLGVPRGLHALWEGSADQMRDDVERFGVVVSRLQRLLEQPTLSSRLIRLRIRGVFEEDAIATFQRQISMHIETLTVIQTLISDQKLETFSQQTTKLVDVSNSAFQTVCSKIASAEASNHERHELQQLGIARVDERLQLLQRQLQLGAVRPNSSLSCSTTIGNRKGGGLQKTMAATIYWSSLYCTLPIGILRVKVTKSRESSASDKAAAQESEQSRISLTFVPPPWLSSIMLQCDLQISHNFQSSRSSLMFNITPFSVNDNPLLRRVIMDNDVAGLQALFTAGLARRTDYIPPHYGLLPVSLTEFFVVAQRYPTSNHYDMFRFLLENCGPMTASQAFWFFFFLRCQNPTSRTVEFLSPYLETFFSYGGSICLTSGFTLLYDLVDATSGFDCIQETLFRQVEPWTIEDLATTDTWLIGVLAHTNGRFRRMVETYLDSYRSPFYNVKTPFGYDSFTSTFGIKTVVAQVKKAPRYSRVDFLRAISASGTHIMLKPFLDAGVDVDEGGTLNNYLGSAARNEKLESFHMLLDANANTALALPDFLYSRDLSSQSGKHFLSTLFENVRPTTLHKLDDDPLLALVGYEEVLQKCPRALHILLENGAFHNCGLYGGRDVNADESNMLKAILYNWSHAVELFLDHGAEANIQIGQLYTASEPYHETITQYTWLTLAVEAGRARCAEILIKYGAKITYPDGSGTTALQLAHDNIDCEHPRKFSLDRYQSYLVEAAEDIEILEVLERGLAGESERTKPSAGSYRAT
ncbi:hypothetical protein MMC16_007324, partial [Acarospora aff. strigata]|nr:hypothetical protein [Acarospora aff. strigata]